MLSETELRETAESTAKRSEECEAKSATHNAELRRAQRSEECEECEQSADHMIRNLDQAYAVSAI